MRSKTFPGGIHPRYHKELASGKAIEKANPPSLVVIPLHQHTGAPCEPLVKPGDTVRVGQKIGDAKAFVSAPVHSSVSGKVKAVEMRPTPDGRDVLSVVIESDGLDTVDESVKPHGDIENLTAEEIKGIIREAGLIGMGGAGFPTHVKLSPPPDKKIDAVIINAAECEPYLTTDHRLMVERPGDVVYGLKAFMKAVGVNRGFIGVEENKPDAIAALQEIVKSEPDIEIVPLHVKYPQGSEKQLIKAILGREVPPGGLPMDVGAIVSNPATAAAATAAIKTGMPLVERVVTVTGGGVKEPKNLLVKVGVSFRELIEQCGGYNGEPGKIISGGPMMGIAQYTTDVPVLKKTSGILVLNRRETQALEPRHCTRCAKCVDVCPMNLLPLQLNALVEKGKWDQLEKLNIMDCVECGSCSYICPCRRPLLQSIRLGKAELRERNAKK